MGSGLRIRWQLTASTRLSWFYSWRQCLMLQLKRLVLAGCQPACWNSKNPSGWSIPKTDLNGSQIGTALQTLGYCVPFVKGGHDTDKRRIYFLYWQISFHCYRCKGRDRNKNETAPKWKGPLCLEHKWHSYFMLVFTKIIFPKTFI